jgi:hypothetical protein
VHDVIPPGEHATTVLDFRGYRMETQLTTPARTGARRARVSSSSAADLLRMERMLEDWMLREPEGFDVAIPVEEFPEIRCQLGTCGKLFRPTPDALLRGRGGKPGRWRFTAVSPNCGKTEGY